MCGINKGSFIKWNFETNSEEVKSLITDTEESITYIQELSSHSILLGSSNGNIYFWENLHNNEPPRIFKGHNHEISAISVLPDKQYFISSSYDKTIRLWEFSSNDYKGIGFLDTIATAIKSDSKSSYTVGSESGIEDWSISLPSLWSKIKEGIKAFIITVWQPNFLVICLVVVCLALTYILWYSHTETLTKTAFDKMLKDIETLVSNNNHTLALSKLNEFKKIYPNNHTTELNGKISETLNKQNDYRTLLKATYTDISKEVEKLEEKKDYISAILSLRDFLAEYPNENSYREQIEKRINVDLKTQKYELDIEKTNVLVQEKKYSEAIQIWEEFLENEHYEVYKSEANSEIEKIRLTQSYSLCMEEVGKLEKSGNYLLAIQKLTTFITKHRENNSYIVDINKKIKELSTATAYKECKQNTNALVKNKKYSQAIKKWREFLEKHSDREYQKSVESEINFLIDNLKRKVKYKVLVFANRDYQNWDDLDAPIKDAEDFAKALESVYGVKTSDISMVLNSDKELMSKIFDKFIDDEIDEEDSVIVYYSGHGAKDKNYTYWVPIDGTNESSTWILKRMANKTLHVLLISDYCFSGGLTKGGEPNTGATFFDINYFKKSCEVITSANGLAMDNYMKSGNSPFARELIRILESVEKDIYSAEEIGLLVKQGVNVLSSQQKPDYGDVEGTTNEGEFFFVKENEKE